MARLVVAGAIAWAVALVAIPGVACAWTVDTVDGIVRISREPSDTAGASVSVYNQTNGSAVINQNAYVDGSYDETGGGKPFSTLAFAFTIPTTDGFVDVPYANQARLVVVDGITRVVINGSPHATTSQGFLATVVSLDPRAGQAAYPVSVQGTVPVSQVASLSVAGTLPVDPWSGTGLPPAFFGLAAVFGVAVTGAALALWTGGLVRDAS